MVFEPAEAATHGKLVQVPPTRIIRAGTLSEEAYAVYLPYETKGPLECLSKPLI